jgi:hypothetical protein
MNAEMLAPLAPTEEASLEVAIQRRLGNRIRNLRVRRLPTGLALQGLTATYYAKQLVIHAAMEFAELPIFANDVQVL